MQCRIPDDTVNWVSCHTENLEIWERSIINTNYIDYHPQKKFGQGNVFTPVCHSVHRGRRSAPLHAGTHTHTHTHTQRQTPFLEETPSWQTPPWQTPPPSDTTGYY